MTKHLGEILKEFREKKGWTQDRMASFVGVSLRSYQAMEKTGNVSKADTLDRIRVFLKAELTDTHKFAEPEPDYQKKKDVYEMKYLELLERNNKTLEQSIQLSLNAILEGQSDLGSFLRLAIQENDNRTFQILRSLAGIEGQLGIGSPPSEVLGNRNVKSGKTDYGGSKDKETGIRGKN